MAEEQSSTLKINVGSRCSELALCQTNLVIKRLNEKNPDLEFNVVKISTKGDETLDKALSKIGGKSLFTKELEVALDAGRVDFVVHSLKDLPTTLPPGLTIGAVIDRHDPRDCVVLHSKHRAVVRLSALPPGAVLGTSSLRRIAQLSRNYPHLKFENIRGNLHTRLRKLDEDGKYDGIVLAAAGIERLGWENRVNMYLDKQDMLYAVSQGAMAVECREGDVKTISLLSPLHDRNTALRVTAERTFMKCLDGGCSVPIGTWSTVEGNSLCLSGGVFSADGSEMLFSERADIIPSLNPFSPDHLFATDHPFSPLGYYSHHQLDMIHGQRPKLTANATAIKGLLNNGIILHRTGMCCPTRHTAMYDLAENCGRALAAVLLEKGAKDVLDRARAAGIVDVNAAPNNKATDVNAATSTKEAGLASNDSNNKISGYVNSSEVSLSGSVSREVGFNDPNVVHLEEVNQEMNNNEGLKRTHRSSAPAYPCKKSRHTPST